MLRRLAARARREALAGVHVDAHLAHALGVELLPAVSALRWKPLLSDAQRLVVIGAQGDDHEGGFIASHQPFGFPGPVVKVGARQTTRGLTPVSALDLPFPLEYVLDQLMDHLW